MAFRRTREEPAEAFQWADLVGACPVEAAEAVEPHRTPGGVPPVGHHQPEDRPLLEARTVPVERTRPAVGRAVPLPAARPELP